jgi:dipeptidyl aminopeptidase/acylaminoacyl peptidase
MEQVETPFTSMSGLRAVRGRAAFIGGSPTEPSSVIELDLDTGQWVVLRRSSELAIDPGFLSTPQPIEFPTALSGSPASGDGLTAYALYYAPRNRDYVTPDDERPPLLVISHGGPTGATSSSLSLGTQYWTSRGFAVLDVNYGGSTGYGRAYRERLNGQWGVMDVDDCVNGALYLAEQAAVDGQRLIIRGGSAGGYTTLCALVFRDVFSAGASYFGVSDLEALALDTHKFESRYLDRLVAPYPEGRELYRERSPIQHTDDLSVPVIFLQGLEDKVVPPNQAESMVEALRSKGVPVAYVPFEGEQHGFRRAENMKRALNAELSFYSQVFGFGLADPVESVDIDNL